MAYQDEKLVAVDAPHFYAGMIMKNGYCIKAAPILQWTVGKCHNYILMYFKKNGWHGFYVK